MREVVQYLIDSNYRFDGYICRHDRAWEVDGKREQLYFKHFLPGGAGCPPEHSQEFDQWVIDSRAAARVALDKESSKFSTAQEIELPLPLACIIARHV